MKKLGQILCALVFAMLPLTGSAIVTADNSVAEDDPFLTNGFNWDYVYAHPDGSCVAVASNWILTASHVADYGGSGMLNIGGTNYLKQEIFFHDTADIALVRYDKAFPGYYAVYSGTTASLVGQDAILAGYGHTGTVSKVTTGFGPWKTTTYFYNDSGSGRNTERWGSNVVSSQETRDYTVGTLPFSSSGFVMKFDADGTEAGVGTYDSGGGSFVYESGVWKLAGINTSRGANLSGYVDTFSVSIPAYAGWINSIIIGTNDFDSDGIPNEWEQQFGSITGVVATVDSDGDGLTGEEEYLADTDPTDDSSFPKINDFSVSAEQTITFNGSTAREYQLFCTTNDLTDAVLTWNAAHSNAVWGTGAGSTIIVTNAEPKVFYRLQVTLP